MIEAILEEIDASHEEKKREHLLQKLVIKPEQTLEEVLRVLRSPNKALWKVATEVIQAIGYPQNASAIPTLLVHICDRNWPGWLEAVYALETMGVDVVVPHLLLYLCTPTLQPDFDFWGYSIESICALLCSVDNQYALECAPMLTTFLERSDLPPDSLDRSFILDVFEKIGVDKALYVLPFLLRLIVKNESTREVKLQARNLLKSVSQEALAPYALILTRLEKEFT